VVGGGSGGCGKRDDESFLQDELNVLENNVKVGCVE
jgi:hypothetical protein